jgi:hypothetical protein
VLIPTKVVDLIPVVTCVLGGIFIVGFAYCAIRDAMHRAKMLDACYGPRR